MKTLYDLFRVNDIEYKDLENEEDKKLVESKVRVLEEDKNYESHILNIITAYPDYYICLNCEFSAYTRVGLHEDMFYRIIGILTEATHNHK